jgi:hypothetical protein
MRRDILAKDVANGEQLYTEFLKELANLYIDSIDRTLDDEPKRASFRRDNNLIRCPPLGLCDEITCQALLPGRVMVGR